MQNEDDVEEQDDEIPTEKRKTKTMAAPMRLLFQILLRRRSPRENEKSSSLNETRRTRRNQTNQANDQDEKREREEAEGKSEIRRHESLDS